ncbi:MAG: hypothetical protein M1829_000174 [Trizodia sp. TS-e1964]|nr:MAG: hypothetical protein M1829_000174 [Trizodia sp. TS-e1964]
MRLSLTRKIVDSGPTATGAHRKHNGFLVFPTLQLLPRLKRALQYETNYGVPDMFPLDVVRQLPLRLYLIGESTAPIAQVKGNMRFYSFAVVPRVEVLEAVAGEAEKACREQLLHLMAGEFKSGLKRSVRRHLRQVERIIMDYAT